MLLSKSFEAFEALSGCLQAHKYESFLNMLTTVDRATIQRVDVKGRNLLHLLGRYGSELDFEENSKEL